MHLPQDALRLRLRRRADRERSEHMRCASRLHTAEISTVQAPSFEMRPAMRFGGSAYFVEHVRGGGEEGGAGVEGLE